MKQNITTQEKIEVLEKDIQSYEANPILKLYGEELGIAKLVRDGRTFRIFVKKVQPAKSGKAMLVKMKVFIQAEGIEFAVVGGHTYLPNFVLENKDVYWIIENKIHGKLEKNPDNISIDSSYIPKEFNTYRNFWSNKNHKSPEQQANEFLNMLKNAKERLEKELRVEVRTLAFMELLA